VKRKLPLILLSALVVLAVLFMPIPKAPYDDGGTREYVALTYKIVDWNRVSADGEYDATRLYFGADRSKTIDELWALEYDRAEKHFVATILELNGDQVLVQPVEIGEPVSFNRQNLNDISARVGDMVKITYTGAVLTTNPAQIGVTAWQLESDLRHLSFDEEWLDKETAEKYDHNIFDHIRITKIYSNCFFARTVIPMPYEIKLNGTLGDEWCVGDQVQCTYENTYYDEKSNRVEVDMLTIAASSWQPDPNAAYKPVIYLYPETELEASVKLRLNGELTCTYPAYRDGWQVTAAPDGTLTDAQGQVYSYLYWEGLLDTQYDLSKGFCVKGADTAAFLEKALAQLGLTRREANEFIVYWLPLMQENPYNIISFQADAYTDAAQLDISPAPDTLIRVFMAWQASDAYVQLEQQELTAPERVGFTAVEWGGAEIK